MDPDQRPTAAASRRLSHRAFDACANALAGHYAPVEPSEFPRHLLAILFKLIPVEQIRYDEFNQSAPRCVALSFPEPPDLQRGCPQLTHRLRTHPLFPTPPVETETGRIAHAIPVRQSTDSFGHQEYFQREGSMRVMLFFLRETPGASISLALYRNGHDFSEGDRRVMAFLLPHISQAWRHASLAWELAAKIKQVGEGLGNLRRAVVLTDPDGKIGWQSPLAAAWLNEFFPGHAVVQELPPPLKARLDKVETTAHGGVPNFFELQMPTGAGSHLLVYSGKTEDGGFLILLIRERAWIDAVLARNFALTQREAEMLFWLSEAKTNLEIAGITGINVRTIHKHMEHLFAKLMVENRQQAQRVGWELRRM